MSTKQTGKPSAAAAAKAQVLQQAAQSVSAIATEPPAQAVPPVTAAAVAKANLPPAPAPVTEFLTVENCTHFQNSEGRVFEATEVLRRLARRQDLKPVNAPE